jgi:signal transduction histidine kinase
MPNDRGLKVLFYPHGELRPNVLLGMIRTRRFIHMRWAAVAGVLALYFLERRYNPDFARPQAVALCAVALALVNMIWLILGRGLMRAAAIGETAMSNVMGRVVWFVNAQMAVDLVTLTVLLRYSGGIENPMVIFYLFHMLIAALLLRPLNALLQGFWALLLFSVLVVGESFGWIAPHYSFLPHPSPEGAHADWMHVLVTTSVLAVGIFGVLFFTLQISSRLDEQESKLHRVMEGLRRSQAAVEDLQARRSRFMQTAAHQLKSPLAGVQTLTGLIRDGIVPPESVQPTCTRIIERCREGIRQVGELLTLARIQQVGPQRQCEKAADIEQIALELEEKYAPLANEGQVELRVQISPNKQYLAPVDPASVSDCIGNLIDNAIKYTPADGRVIVTVDRQILPESPDSQEAPPAPHAPEKMPAEFIVVTVADTGMGIEPEALVGAEDTAGGSIFDAFLRGSRALAAGIPGTGLGLAIVREVVEQVGGRITVRSDVGRGSEFTVAFPTLPAESNHPPVQDTRTSITVLSSTENRSDASRDVSSHRDKNGGAAGPVSYNCREDPPGGS